MDHYEQSRQIVREAGARLLSMHEMRVEEKTDFKDLVTSCDKATQAYLVEKLGALYPQATFFCEEGDAQDGSGEHMFIIDPIDGTANFVYGYNQSAISVAYADRTEVLWGMVYNPYTEEFYEARKGEGAFLNGSPIHVSADSLKHSLVNFGTSPYYRELRGETFEIAERVMEYSMDVRRSGSAALDLCYVAAGRCGAYFELQLSPWDYAAGLCIVKEAGGVVTDMEGNPPCLTGKSGIAAGNPTAWKEFMDKMKLP